MTEFNLSEKRRKLYGALNKVRLNEITIYDMMSLIRMQDKEFIKKLKKKAELDDIDCAIVDKLAGDNLK